MTYLHVVKSWSHKDMEETPLKWAHLYCFYLWWTPSTTPCHLGECRWMKMSVIYHIVQLGLIEWHLNSIQGNYIREKTLTTSKHSHISKQWCDTWLKLFHQKTNKTAAAAAHRRYFSHIIFSMDIRVWWFSLFWLIVDLSLFLSSPSFEKDWSQLPLAVQLTQWMWLKIHRALSWGLRDRALPMFSLLAKSFLWPLC